jgi:hypothetical protein
LPVSSLTVRRCRIISSGVYRFLGMTLTSLVAAQPNNHPGPNLPGQVPGSSPVRTIAQGDHSVSNLPILDSSRLSGAVTEKVRGCEYPARRCSPISSYSGEDLRSQKFFSWMEMSEIEPYALRGLAHSDSLTVILLMPMSNRSL